MITPVFNVFYRDYDNDVMIKSSAPEALSGDRIFSLAEKLLRNPDNFLGIVDDQEQILQCCVDDDGKVMMELLYPDSKGGLQLKMSWDRASKLLSDLPQPFTESLLPGAQYLG